MGTSGPSGEHLRACFPMQVDETYLQLEFIEILLPVIGPIDSRATVGRVETDTERTVKRPTTKHEVPSRTIGKHNSTSTESVGLDVHRAPREVEVVDEREVELVRARRVGELGRAELFDHRNLVVDAEGHDQGHDDASDLHRVKKASWSRAGDVPRTTKCKSVVTLVTCI